MLLSVPISQLACAVSQALNRNNQPVLLVWFLNFCKKKILENMSQYLFRNGTQKTT